MVSTLKVNKIQIPNSDSDVISLDASTGNITIPKDVTFSGTVTGDNSGLTKLYTQTGSDAVSSIDIDDTYINSTYDTYYIVGHCLPATDSVRFDLKLKDASGIITGNKHGYDKQYLALGQEVQAGDFISLNYSLIGNVAGEGSQFSFYMMHVNSTTVPCTLIGGAKTLILMETLKVFILQVD